MAISLDRYCIEGTSYHHVCNKTDRRAIHSLDSSTLMDNLQFCGKHHTRNLHSCYLSKVCLISAHQSPTSLNLELQTDFYYFEHSVLLSQIRAATIKRHSFIALKHLTNLNQPGSTVVIETHQRHRYNLNLVNHL